MAPQPDANVASSSFHGVLKNGENMTLSDRLDISEGSNARHLRWGVVRDLNLFIQDVSIRLDKRFEVELSPVGHFETVDWCRSLVLGHGP